MMSQGEQKDFVKATEVENGLVEARRVYRGWRGVDVPISGEYHGGS